MTQHGAGDVLMAVPVFYIQHVSPNLKIFFFIIISSASCSAALVLLETSLGR